MLLATLTGKKLLERFTKKKMQKRIKNYLELKKLLREKLINYKLNGKVKIIHNSNKIYNYNIWIDIKDVAYLSEYFPKSNSLGGRVKVQLDLSNYVTETDLQNATGLDTSSFAKKND